MKVSGQYSRDSSAKVIRTRVYGKRKGEGAKHEKVIGQDIY